MMVLAIESMPFLTLRYLTSFCICQYSDGRSAFVSLLLSTASSSSSLSVELSLKESSASTGVFVFILSTRIKNANLVVGVRAVEIRKDMTQDFYESFGFQGEKKKFTLEKSSSSLASVFLVYLCKDWKFEMVDTVIYGRLKHKHSKNKAQIRSETFKWN